jgi:nitroimidazol reductase NimA-like FMN-containing flavoprotein (pyridoxamine 5'-phosphate oxidase superfamily)
MDSSTSAVPTAPGVVDTRFSEPGAPPVSWPAVESVLTGAEIFWFTSVRTDGRPHVTPLIAVWHRGSLYVTTGGAEQKARNVEANPQIVITTGSNSIAEGVDIVIEGTVERVRDESALRPLADAFVTKYGEYWRFDVVDGDFQHQGGGEAVLVFRIAARKILAFSKGAPFSQTGWRFSDAASAA